MHPHYDVLVIGGGVAGTAAALAAAARGARCAVVQAAPGASAVCAGAWWSEPPAALAERLARVGLSLVPCAAPLAHPVGELRACACAGATHAAAAPQSGVLVAGVAGLPGFRAAALARLWGDAAGVTLQATTLLLPRSPAAGWAPASLAAALEREPALLADELARAVQQVGATAAIVPAVLGIDDAGRVHEAVERAAGVPIGESLGVPPSLPGLRLQRALARVLAEAGIDLVRGHARGGHDANGRLEAVSVEAPGAPAQRVHAGGFVLATGRFLGGGIVADPVLRDAALGLPLSLTHLGTEFTRLEPLALSSPGRTDPQPWLAAGVPVDAEARPLGPDGAPRWRNVHAAGAVVADARADLGEAAHAGWRAGAFAAAGAETSVR